MTSDTIDSIKKILTETFFKNKLSLLNLRDTFENFYTSRTKNRFVPNKTFRIEHSPAFILNNPQNKFGKIALFLHAGGFTMGSTRSHWDLITLLSQASNIDILSINYRLAPENPFPAQIEDSLNAYKWLLANNYAPQNIILMGLTTGATLVLAMLLALRETGLPMPRAAVAISPITDFALKPENFYHNDWLPFERLNRLRAAYINDREVSHPLISPFYGELNGLPDILLQVGSDEILKNDSLRFYEKAKKTNTNIVLDIRENLFHCAHQFAYSLPEAQAAIFYIGEYLNQKVIQKD